MKTFCTRDNIYKSVWLIDCNWIRDNSFIDWDLHSKYIIQSMQYIQDDIITNVLGDDLAKILNDLIVTDEIYLHEKFEYMIEKYIAYIFLYGIPLHSTIPLSWQIRNAGLIQQTGESFNPTSMEDLKTVNAWYATKVDEYTARLVRYLNSIKDYIRSEFPGIQSPVFFEEEVVRQPFKTNYIPSVHQIARRWGTNIYNN